MANRSLALVIALALAAVVLQGAPARAQPAAPAQPPTPTPAPPGQPAPAAPPAAPEIPAVPQVPLLPPRPLTLPDAITTGLQNNLQIKQAALAVTIARAQLGQAEAQKALTLGGSASFATNSVSGGGAPLTGTISIPGAGIAGQSFVASGVAGTGTPATQWAFGLTLKYPLYTGNALEDQIAIAQANVRIAEAGFALSAQQVVLAVRQAYYSLEQAQGSVDAAQRAVDAAQENVRVTQARVQAGTSPQFDLLQAQVQLAQSQQVLTAARTGLAQSQQGLAQVLYLPLSTTVAPGTPMGLPASPQDVAALIQQAMQNRPELAQVRATIEADQAAIDLAASGLRPNISVSAGPQIQTADPTNKDVVNFTGSIVLTIAILDGGLTQAKIDQARAQLQSAQVSDAQTRQQVELDVRNAFLGLNNAAEQLRSALAAQTAAREALRIANVRFQAGVGTQLEVVTAQQNLATADQGVVAARFQYNLALAQLDRAIGVQVKI